MIKSLGPIAGRVLRTRNAWFVAIRKHWILSRDALLGQPAFNWCAFAFVFFAPFALTSMHVGIAKGIGAPIVAVLQTSEYEAAVPAADVCNPDKPIITSTNPPPVAGKDQKNPCAVLRSRQMQASNALIQGQTAVVTLIPLLFGLLAWTILRRWGWGLLLAALTLAIGRGALFVAKIGTPFDEMSGPAVFLYGLKPRYDSDWTIPDAALDIFTTSLTNDWNIIGYIIWCTAGLVVVALSFSVLARNRSDLLADLHARRSELMIIGVCMALLYAIAIYRVRTRLMWPIYQLDGAAVEAMEAAIQSTVGVWAWMFTINLLVIYGAAMLVYRRDVDRAAAAAIDGSPAKRTKWIEENQLVFPVKDTLAVLGAGLSPVFAATTVDLLARL